MSSKRDNAITTGLNGAVVLKKGGTAESATGEFGRIQCLVACDVIALTAPIITNVSDITALTLNQELVGTFTAVDVSGSSAGMVICYNG